MFHFLLLTCSNILINLVLDKKGIPLTSRQYTCKSIMVTSYSIKPNNSRIWLKWWNQFQSKRLLLLCYLSFKWTFKSIFPRLYMNHTARRVGRYVYYKCFYLICLSIPITNLENFLSQSCKLQCRVVVNASVIIRHRSSQFEYVNKWKYHK